MRFPKAIGTCVSNAWRPDYLRSLRRNTPARSRTRARLRQNSDKNAHRDSRPFTASASDELTERTPARVTPLPGQLRYRSGLKALDEELVPNVTQRPETGWMRGGVILSRLAAALPLTLCVMSVTRQPDAKGLETNTLDARCGVIEWFKPVTGSDLALPSWF